MVIIRTIIVGLVRAAPRAEYIVSKIPISLMAGILAILRRRMKRRPGSGSVRTERTGHVRRSVDGMTASFGSLPTQLLGTISGNILKRPGVDAVFVDVTNKPPATIEWE